MVTWWIVALLCRAKTYFDSAIPASSDEPSVFVIKCHTGDGVLSVCSTKFEDGGTSLKVPDLDRLKSISIVLKMAALQLAMVY